jgi:branched-chain amino acid transport system ATP-binding protein
MTPSPPVLQIAGLSARYGTSTVLRDVTLDVPAGKVVALLGPNGAGKTTLMRAAAGLVTSTSGTVSLAGSDVTGSRPHRRAQEGLCLVPEGRGIFPNLTVRENLLLQSKSRSQGANIETVLDAFPVLGKRLGTLAGRLSGGEQQMIALGRCFASNPKVILLDEVSMGLAPLVVDQIFGALDALSHTGVALLIVEQYVSRALAMADSVYLLSRGEISWHGGPSEITEEEIMRRYLAVDLHAQDDSNAPR